MNKETFMENLHGYVFDDEFPENLRKEMRDFLVTDDGAWDEYVELVEFKRQLKRVMKDKAPRIPLRQIEREFRQKKLSEIKVYFDDEGQPIHHSQRGATLELKKPTDVVIKFPGQPDWQHRFTSQEIFTLPKAASSQAETEKKQVFETEHLIIEIEKGKPAGTLTLIPK
jgi:hypothetical protein